MKARPQKPRSCAAVQAQRGSRRHQPHGRKKSSDAARVAREQGQANLRRRRKVHICSSGHDSHRLPVQFDERVLLQRRDDGRQVRLKKRLEFARSNVAGADERRVSLRSLGGWLVAECQACVFRHAGRKAELAGSPQLPGKLLIMFQQPLRIVAAPRRDALARSADFFDFLFKNHRLPPSVAAGWTTPAPAAPRASSPTGCAGPCSHWPDERSSPPKTRSTAAWRSGFNSVCHWSKVMRSDSSLARSASGVMASGRSVSASAHSSSNPSPLAMALESKAACSWRSSTEGVAASSSCSSKSWQTRQKLNQETTRATKGCRRDLTSASSTSANRPAVRQRSLADSESVVVGLMRRVYAAAPAAASAATCRGKEIESIP